MYFIALKPSRSKRWVKAHHTSRGNNAADRLANLGALKPRKSPAALATAKLDKDISMLLRTPKDNPPTIEVEAEARRTPIVSMSYRSPLTMNTNDYSSSSSSSFQSYTSPYSLLTSDDNLSPLKDSNCTKMTADNPESPNDFVITDDDFFSMEELIAIEM